MSTSTSSFLSHFVNSARLVGVIGSGVAAGYCLNSTHGGMHCLLRANVPGQHIASAWKVLHLRTAYVIISTILVSGTSFFIASYKSHRDLPILTTPLGLHPSTQFALAGVTLVLVFPWTFTIMLPGIDRLKAEVTTIEEAKNFGVGKEVEVDEGSVRKDVEDWAKQNVVRIALFAGAFFLGVAV